MALNDFLKVQEEASEKDEALVVNSRPGTIDVTAEETGKFPFDAFGFDTADGNEWPQIWVKYPWSILGPTICLRPRDEGDDDEYIDQALSHLATNGGTLLLTDGVFMVNENLTNSVTAGKTVVLRGSGNTVVQGSGRISFIGDGDVVIRGITFTGNAYTDSDFYIGPVTGKIALSTTGKHSGIYDCVFRNLHEFLEAIYLHATNYCVVSRNKIYDFYELHDGTTRYPAIHVISTNSYAKVCDNVCIDNGNLIDRSDCQHATPPMIFGETVPNTNNCDWERVACADEGITGYGGEEYCYKLEITSAGTMAYAYFSNDGYTAADLHGLVSGLTYKGIVQIYTPTTDGVAPGDISLNQRDYDGVNSTTESSSPTTSDEWNEVEAELTLQDDATGWGLRVVVGGGDAVAEEYFYVSHVRLVPIGHHNEHEQHFINDGTGTQINGNSWQNPFPA